jgi:hypothetical protein
MDQVMSVSFDPRRLPMHSLRKHRLATLLTALFTVVISTCTALASDSLEVFDRPMGVSLAPYTMRSSAYGFTLCLYDSLDTAVTYVHTYAGDSIHRRTLRIGRINQATLHNDTLYCTGVPSRPVPEFLVCIPPIGKITRIPLEVPVEARGSARRVTVVDGNVGVDSPFFGPLVYLKGDSMLRFADRRTRNADIPKGQKEVFFLHDTTHVLADSHYSIPFDSGDTPTPTDDVAHWVGATISHQDVRWIDRSNVLHVIDIASGDEQRISVNGDYKGGYSGKYGLYHYGDGPDTNEYYQPYNGQSVRVPLTAEAQAAIGRYGGVGRVWHEGYFYLVREVRGTGSFNEHAKVVVLRYREPEPATSVAAPTDLSHVRRPVRALTRSVFIEEYNAMVHEDPYTAVRTIVGQVVDAAVVPTGLVLLSGRSSTTCVLVLPD